MKLAFAISAVARLDLLHQREPEPLRRAALDLALDRSGLTALPDVLRGADPDDAGEAEVDVHLHDDPHRRDRERDVRGAARDLARLGIERERARVTVDALDVDLAAARRSRSSSAARHAVCTAPAAIHVIRDAEEEPAEPTVAVVPARADVVCPELEPRHLEDDVVTPWPTSAAAQCTSAEPSSASTTRAAQ